MIAALSTTGLGLLLTLAPSIALICAGLALVSAGVFVANSAASSRLGRVTGRGKPTGAGLYVSAYYAGGSAGALVPGVAYSLGGWPACVACILLVTGLSAVIAALMWQPGAEA